MASCSFVTWNHNPKSSKLRILGRVRHSTRATRKQRYKKAVGEWFQCVSERRPAVPTPFPPFAAQSSGGMSFWFCFGGNNHHLALESQIGGWSTRRQLVLVEVGRLADDHRAAPTTTLLAGVVVVDAAAQFGADQRVEHFADGETANGEALVVGVVVFRWVVVV